MEFVHSGDREEDDRSGYERRLVATRGERK